MRDIAELPGITVAAIELLREAGIKTVEQFIDGDVSEICKRIKIAGQYSSRGIDCPSQNLIVAWQMTGLEMLERRVREPQREASELPLETIQEAGIDIEALPVARILKAKSVMEATGAPEAEGEGKMKPGFEEREESPASVMGRRRPAGIPEENSPMESTVAPEAEVEMKPGFQVERDASVLVRSGRTQEPFRSLSGLQEAESRRERRNRGVSHPQAGLVRVAAAVTVAATLLGLLAVAGLIVIGSMVFGFGSQIPPRVFLAFLVIPLALILYILLAINARCRVCGQRCFVSKNCRKHERAVRSILGYGFASARDALLFPSFRCMYCGTKIRLRD